MKVSDSHAAARVPAHPLLAALPRVRAGSLALTTPEGNRLDFAGREEGPEADIALKQWSALDALLARGETGFAEAYMDGRWDSGDLPALLTFGAVNADTLEAYFHGRKWYALWSHLKARLKDNSLTGSRRNIHQHYDLGNAFYALWLDASMTYSCALFEEDESRTLEEAQQAKYARILRKLAPQPGAQLLEIGCGWGGFAEAAAKAGCRVTAITISEEQYRFAQARIARQGLAELAEIRLQDYRQMDGQYDHIVSIGMFEHVGERYWGAYFGGVHRLLKPGGTAVIQCITLAEALWEKLQGQSGFIEQYIFPGGQLASRERFAAAAQQAGLAVQEMFVFGHDYARTLRHWLQRFDAARDQVLAMGYDERFIRMWRFYLASCIAAFTAERTSVMQACLQRNPL